MEPFLLASDANVSLVEAAIGQELPRTVALYQPMAADASPMLVTMPPWTVEFTLQRPLPVLVVRHRLWNKYSWSSGRDALKERIIQAPALYAQWESRALPVKRKWKERQEEEEKKDDGKPLPDVMDDEMERAGHNQAAVPKESFRIVVHGDVYSLSSTSLHVVRWVLDWLWSRGQRGEGLARVVHCAACRDVLDRGERLDPYVCPHTPQPLPLLTTLLIPSAYDSKKRAWPTGAALDFYWRLQLPAWNNLTQWRVAQTALMPMALLKPRYPHTEVVDRLEVAMRRAKVRPVDITAMVNVIRAGDDLLASTEADVPTHPLAVCRLVKQVKTMRRPKPASPAAPMPAEEKPTEPEPKRKRVIPVEEGRERRQPSLATFFTKPQK